MASFKGRSERAIKLPVTAIWREAVELEWLIGWDDVRMPGRPAPGGDFTVTDELRSFTGRFTVYEPPADPGSRARLSWTVDDGSSGSLALAPTGAATHAVLTEVSVPHGVDRIFALGVSLVPGKVRRLSDEDCAKDLRALASRAARHAQGRQWLTKGRTSVRQLAAYCPYDWASADADSLPEFDGAGEFRAEPGETVLAETTAAIVSTAAVGDYGREEFQTLWRADDDRAQVRLTDRRLIYRVPATAGNGEVFAGHLRHAHVANLILGDGSICGLPDEARVTATVLEPPGVGVRVHLLCADADTLARAWAAAVMAWRLTRYPDQAEQLGVPDFVDGFWGPLAKLALYCPLGSDQPVGHTRRLGSVS